MGLAVVLVALVASAMVFLVMNSSALRWASAAASRVSLGDGAFWGEEAGAGATATGGGGMVDAAAGGGPPMPIFWARVFFLRTTGLLLVAFPKVMPAPVGKPGIIPGEGDDVVVGKSMTLVDGTGEGLLTIEEAVDPVRTKETVENAGAGAGGASASSVERDVPADRKLNALEAAAPALVALLLARSSSPNVSGGLSGDGIIKLNADDSAPVFVVSTATSGAAAGVGSDEESCIKKEKPLKAADGGSGAADDSAAGAPAFKKEKPLLTAGSAAADGDSEFRNPKALIDAGAAPLLSSSPGPFSSSPPNMMLQG